MERRPFLPFYPFGAGSLFPASPFTLPHTITAILSPYTGKKTLYTANTKATGEAMKGSLTFLSALPPPPITPKGEMEGGREGNQRKRSGYTFSKGQGFLPSTTPLESFLESSGQEGNKQDKEGAL
jgi:hypothetical protein